MWRWLPNQTLQQISGNPLKTLFYEQKPSLVVINSLTDKRSIWSTEKRSKRLKGTFSQYLTNLWNPKGSPHHLFFYSVCVMRTMWNARNWYFADSPVFHLLTKIRDFQLYTHWREDINGSWRSSMSGVDLITESYSRRSDDALKSELT